MEHVNSQTLEMYRQKVEKAVNKKRKKNIAAKICTPLGYSIFVLFFIFAAGCVYSIIGCLSATSFDIFSFTGTWLHSMLGNGWLVLLTIVVLAFSTVFVPLLITMFIAGLIHLFTPHQPLTIDQSQPLPYLKKLRGEASKANKYPHANLDDILKHPFLLAWFLLFAGSFVMVFFLSPEPDAYERFAMALVFSGVSTILLCLPLFIAYNCFDSLYFSFLTKKVKNAYKLYEEIATLHDKEEELVEKEQAAIRAAQEEKEAAERKAEGTRIYEQAVAAGAADEALIKRTADMGCVQARLEYAEILRGKIDSNMFTDVEKEEIMEQAEEYLEPIRETSAVAHLLWVHAHTYHATLRESEWYEVLKLLRILGDSGQLPAKYMDLCNAEIQNVVFTINHGRDEPAPSQPVHYETPSSRPMTFSEKEDYIRRRFGAMYSYGNMQAIDSDPNLTPSQKAELKHHLKYYGD